MIQQILEKCLAELKNETPSLDYVRGMLEVLLASQPKTPSSTVERPSPKGQTAGSIPQGSATEAELLDAKARASLEVVKKLNLE